MELHPMQQPMPAGNGGLCLCMCEGFLPHAVSQRGGKGLFEEEPKAAHVAV